MSNSLTPEEIEQERQIENRRIAFLDAKLAALTRQQRKQAMNYLTRTAKQAVGLLHARATRWKLFQLSGDLIRLKFTIFSTKHNVRGHTGRVASGAAWADKNMIGILDHFALASKEVIQKVVIHECLHILHPLIRHKLSQQSIRPGIEHDYSLQQHSEEEWVRQMEERICGRIGYLEFWELAVEEGGDNWKFLYEHIIKQYSSCLSRLRTTPHPAKV